MALLPPEVGVNRHGLIRKAGSQRKVTGSRSSCSNICSVNFRSIGGLTANCTSPTNKKMRIVLLLLITLVGWATGKLESYSLSLDN